MGELEPGHFPLHQVVFVTLNILYSTILLHWINNHPGCLRCAGIHRNLGVHISKVRSVNLDSWTPQQVAVGFVQP